MNGAIPRAVVLGLGNTMMGDDGVGVEVVSGLQSMGGRRVSFVPGGTAGVGLIPWFLHSGLVIVVDALYAAAAPGSIFRFTADSTGVLPLSSHHMHGMGIPHLVAFARLKGFSPDVVVYAIQVERVAPADGVLSRPVREAVGPARKLVLEELKRKCVPCVAEARRAGRIASTAGPGARQLKK